MRILIAEDEVRLADALSQVLAEGGFDSETVYNGEDALSYALLGDYDALLLDVMLPGRDGFSVAKTLREKQNRTPILMLTARDEVADKVRGLDCGADDYLTKPFSPEELLARLRAVSRRQGDVVLEQLHCYDLCLNLTAYTLSRGEKSVHLSRKEFEVARILLSNPHGIVTKEELLTKVWGAESDAGDNNVEAYVSFLRKKLFFLGSSMEIGSVRGIGYRLEGENT